MVEVERKDTQMCAGTAAHKHIIYICINIYIYIYISIYICMYQPYTL